MSKHVSTIRLRALPFAIFVAGLLTAGYILPF